MEAAMRQAGVPLYSLETKHALRAFDLIGISLPYETLYTNTLNLLDLAGIPLRTSERDREDPVLLAGGHATYNPEPMAEFIDAFAIGEGEELMVEVVDVVRRWRASGGPRGDLHRALARIWGVTSVAVPIGSRRRRTLERVEARWRLRPLAPPSASSLICRRR
jgi:radical SAM superfamily enzyme YgiQ (UPF0313 family)